MKLGLLVVLAVAVLVPSLSEGRTVSKCELKEKLEDAISLPRWWPRWYKERILARVVCKVYTLSRFNTELVRKYGQRRTTTTAPAMTTRPMTTGSRVTRPMTTRSRATRPPTNESMTARPRTTGSRVTRPPTNESMTARPMTTGPRATRPPTNESMTARPRTTGSRVTRPPVNESVTATSSTFERTAQTAGNRKKRDADSASDDEPDTTELDRSLEGILNEEGEELEGHGDNNSMDDKDEQNDEDGDEQELDDDNSINDDDEEDGDEQELEEGGKRKKRRAFRRRRRSVGFYGIFQLSDRYFCDSGENPSRNRCGTSCSAFTDDNIMDDINCIVRTRHWRRLYFRAPRWCHRIRQNFFRECE